MNKAFDEYEYELVSNFITEVCSRGTDEVRRLISQIDKKKGSIPELKGIDDHLVGTVLEELRAVLALQDAAGGQDLPIAGNG